ILTDILGASDVYKRIKYQKKVYGEFENTKKRIDAYIPETRVLIEQKSRGIDLSAPQPGHDNMTPYQQAKKYSNSLTTDETPYWIVLSNFAEIWVYNMRDDRPEQTVTKFKLEDLLLSCILFGSKTCHIQSN
ncbi:MAG: type IIL restriction-modification enzyme MmeI, partial [Hominisplanchenecus sp.]